MGLTIVNGYPCRDCGDIAKAKRGDDPSKSPDEIEAAKRQKEAAALGQDPAVAFGGALAGLATTTPSDPSAAQDPNRPGQRVNVVA